MKLYSTSQVRKLDEVTYREYRIPSLLLMEHAGTQAATAVEEFHENLSGKNILVVCGTGNNGGDGFVAARILRDWGADVSVFLPESPTKLQGDAKINHEILQTLSPSIFIHPEKFPEALAKCDSLIDALFGTGLTRPTEGNTSKIIQIMNQTGKPIFSIDLPSGIDGDTGNILGISIQAFCTITLGVPKVGLFLYPGRAKTGTLKIAYLPIPAQAIQQSPFTAELIEASTVGIWFSPWPADIHKGRRGKALILAGSRGYSGAAALSALGCLRSGTGLTYLAVPDGIRTLLEHKLNEPIKVGIPQSPNWTFGKESLPATREWLKKADAAAIGPGIGRAQETQDYVKTVIAEYSGPLVVDADALFPLEEEFLKKHGRLSLILTPHEGEMARLCGVSPEEVRQNRLSLVKEKASLWNVTLLLKGASTLIGAPDSLWINSTGNPGMATGGSGDVLTGMIVSFLAQGFSPEKAASAAAFLHGLSGDLLREERGMYGVASELLAENLYKTFLRLSEESGAPSASC